MWERRVYPAKYFSNMSWTCAKGSLVTCAKTSVHSALSADLMKINIRLGAHVTAALSSSRSQGNNGLKAAYNPNHPPRNQIPGRDRMLMQSFAPGRICTHRGGKLHQLLYIQCSYPGFGVIYRSRHQIAICGGCDVYIGFKPR